MLFNLPNTAPQSTRKDLLPGYILRIKHADSASGPALKPIDPIPSVGGQPSSMASPNQPAPPPQAPAQPFQNAQPNPQSWRPSVVAQLAAEKGDPNAWIYGLFKPQQAPQQSPMSPMQQPQQQPPVNPIKQGSCILTTLAINTFRQPIQQPMILKLAALAISREPVPADWNKSLTEPTEINGGIRSDGREAWDSVNHYKRTTSQPSLLDDVLHKPGHKRKPTRKRG
jgi:hypothetical protein